MLQIPALATSSSDLDQQQQPKRAPSSESTTTTTTTSSNIVCRGRILMLYAGAGNKLVQRHIELVTGAKLRIFLESNTLGDAGEPQATISLTGCVLADYPENALLGFSLCRSNDGFTISRLGQFLFVCLSVEDKRKWMWALQQEIFRDGGEEAIQTNSETSGTSEAKRSSLNKLRFNTENYVIDRGCRPPLLRGFYLKRTGNFLQEYVVRWMELRDRVSNDNPTTLGGIVYAGYIAAPPAEWSFIPMRVDTKVSQSPEKFRISISGSNQDTVFVKFDSLEVMEEWYQNLVMLVERATIENDPQFAMAMKLNERGGSRDKEEDALLVEQLGETMAIGKLKKEMMEMNWGSSDGDDEDHDNGPTTKKFNNNNRANNNNNNLRSSPGLSATANPSNNIHHHHHASSSSHEDDVDSEDELDVADLESDSPLRVRYSTILYAVSDQPKTIVADRDTSEKVTPLLMEIISAPISNFRPDFSPYRPQGKTAQMYYEKEKEIENKSFNTNNNNCLAAATNNNNVVVNSNASFNNNNNNSSLQLISHKANQQQSRAIATATASPFGNTPLQDPQQQNQSSSSSSSATTAMTEEEVELEKHFRPENPTVEDVLERFERHTLMAIEVLGPSPVLIRLRKELDEDAADLKYVALHIINTFPRELTAAYLAQRLDNALIEFQTIRDSLIVRIDMAKFREEFRLVGGVASSSSSSSSTTTSGGLSSATILGNPTSLTAAFAKKKESNLTVDEALRAIDRVTTESALMKDNNNNLLNSTIGTAKKASETNAKIRDAIQFLQHFLKQFRENFDVFDDAGYLVSEVAGAIERGTNFLQEL